MEEIFDTFLNIIKNINYKRLIFPTIIILLYLFEFYYLNSLIAEKDEKSNEKTNEIIVEKGNDQVEEIPGYIYIDVKGSVSKPGVYKLDTTSRVIDAIEAAGGLKKDANTRFINLSKSLLDGDVIVIYSNAEIKNAKKENIIKVETPCVCEEIKNDSCYEEKESNKVVEVVDNNTVVDEKTSDKENEKVSDKININTASNTELETLNGIGQSKSKAIIEYRKSNGLFKVIEDIMNVSGISETIFAKIKENITV